VEINKAEYIGSFLQESKCPTDKRAEYAFIGRSNVGKSSLINLLCGRKELARISKKPGKTQLLNFFLINETWYLVDLPGFGYAKISKKKRFEWEDMIAHYLKKRKNLQCAFVLVDANVPPQQIDIEFINWLGKMQIPFVLAYTKTDKLTINKLNQNIQVIEKELHKYWNELPQRFITSAKEGIGKEEILALIDAVNRQFL